MSTFLFGDEKPPRFAQISDASGVVRYSTNALAAGFALNITTMSPPPTTERPASPIFGNGKTLKPVSGSSGFFSPATPGTKSPSSTSAAFGVFEKTFATEVGKSVCRAPAWPPAMLSVSPTIFAISASASLTDWSVHGISCLASLSYVSGPAVWM